MATGRKPPTDDDIRRGAAIKAFRIANKWTQAELAQRLNLQSREAVSQYESGGGIARPALVELVRLGMSATVLRIDEADLVPDPQLANVSADARRIAFAWDGLPPALQTCITAYVDAWSAAEKASPVLAKVLKARPEPVSQAKHHEVIEKFQEANHKPHPKKRQPAS